MSVRRSVLLLAVVVIPTFFLGIPPSVAQDAGPPPEGNELTISASPASLEIDFGHEWNAERRTVLVTLSGPFTDEVAADVVVQPTREDNKEALPAEVISITVTETGYDSERLIAVTVNPRNIASAGLGQSKPQPGVFEGIIRLRAGTATSTLPLKITLQGEPPWGAWVLIFAGLIMGWVFKWWGDTGKKMAVIVRRQQGVESRLRGLIGDLPKTFRDTREELQESVEAFDAGAAEVALQKLEQGLDDMLEVAGTVDRLRKQIRDHVALTQEERNSGKESVPELETDLLDGALRVRATSELKREVAAAQAVIDDVDRVLRSSGEAPNLGIYQTETAKKLVSALGKKVSRTAARRGRAQVESEEKEKAERRAPTRSRLKKVLLILAKPFVWTFGGGRQRLLTRVLPAAIGLATFVIFAFIGLQSQYYENVSFGEGAFVDWLGLFLWGFAAVATGKTVTDFFGQVSSGAGGAPAGT